LRAVAVTTRSHATELPTVPTIIEAGARAAEVVTASGLLAPAKTPPEVIKVLNSALNATSATPEVHKQLAALGATPRPMSASDCAAFLERQDENAARLVNSGQLKPEAVSAPGQPQQRGAEVPARCG